VKADPRDLDLSELLRRRTSARRMRYGIVAVPLALLVALRAVLEAGLTTLTAVGVVLVLYGGVSSYALGVRWERRWDQLIRAKAPLGDAERRPARAERW
jgi:hypothetical protein